MGVAKGPSYEAVTWIAFSDQKKVASGVPEDVAGAVKKLSSDSQPWPNVLVFDALTSHPVDLDLRGDEEAVREWARNYQSPYRKAAEQELEKSSSNPSRNPPPNKVGRPKLGVKAKEVTLLPRHWAWLKSQPGGASVTLRKLVDKAQRENREQDQLRFAQEATYGFMQAIAGDEPHYEEASRALFAGDMKSFAEWIKDWPIDIKEHTLQLAMAIRS